MNININDGNTIGNTYSIKSNTSCKPFQVIRSSKIYSFQKQVLTKIKTYRTQKQLNRLEYKKNSIKHIKYRFLFKNVYFFRCVFDSFLYYNIDLSKL